MKSPRLRQTVFRLKISSFLAFSTFEKGFLWHSRWGGGVTRANFCITRGSLSWLVAPRDAKIGTRDTTPSPLVPQKALFKGLEGPKDWFSAEKQFALPQTFHVVLTNIIKYYLPRSGKFVHVYMTWSHFFMHFGITSPMIRTLGAGDNKIVFATQWQIRSCFNDMKWLFLAFWDHLPYD